MRAVLFAVLFSMSLVGARAEAVTFDFVWEEFDGNGQAVGQVTFAGSTFTGGPATSLIFTSVSTDGVLPATISALSLFGDPIFDWVVDLPGQFTDPWGVNAAGLPIVPDCFPCAESFSGDFLVLSTSDESFIPFGSSLVISQVTRPPLLPSPR